MTAIPRSTVFQMASALRLEREISRALGRMHDLPDTFELSVVEDGGSITTLCQIEQTRLRALLDLMLESVRGELATLGVEP